MAAAASAGQAGSLITTLTSGHSSTNETPTVAGTKATASEVTVDHRRHRRRHRARPDTRRPPSAESGCSGIEAPETAHGGEPANCYGDAATELLAQLSPPGTTVILSADPRESDRDVYDRLLRYVDQLGEDLSATMLAAGAARHHHSDPPLLRASEHKVAAVTPRTTRVDRGAPAEVRTGSRHVIAPTALRDLGDQHRRARRGAGHDSRHEGRKIMSGDADRHEAELEEQARRRTEEISAGGAAAERAAVMDEDRSPDAEIAQVQRSGQQHDYTDTAAHLQQQPAILTTTAPARAPSAPTSVPLPPPRTAPTRTSPPCRSGRPLTRWVECSHTLSGLPCMTHHPHVGDGRGCVHYSTSGVPDRHDYGDGE